jgi:hypothetical protein
MITPDEEFCANIKDYIDNVQKLFETMPHTSVKEQREEITIEYSKSEPCVLPKEEVFTNGNIKSDYFWSRPSIKD